MDTIRRNQDLEAISNELYDINENQALLRERKMELKILMADGMGDAEVYKGALGTIKKVSRKPKRIYDRDRLEAELKRQRFSENAIESIVKASIRQINVSEHLSVNSKRQR